MRLTTLSHDKSFTMAIDQTQSPKVSKHHSHRIHWLTYQPTPYNDYLFRNLDAADEIDLTVYFRQTSVSSHPWKSNLAEGYNSQVYNLVLGVDWSIVSLPFRDPQGFFLIAGWDHPTSQILLTLLRVFRFKYGLWTDTPNLNRPRTPLKSLLRSIWLKWIFSGAAQILGTGKIGVANLHKMGAESAKLINFPTFLNLADYDREQPQYDRNQPLRFISSGTINNSVKGHDLAIRALSIAAKKYPDITFEYYIAGTGPDESELKKLVAELGIESQVKFLGWTEPETLREYYLKAHALIHPSRTHDSYPNAVLEGMAAGLVVFGSDVSGSVTDRIENGVSGFIHQAGNVDQLAAQIIAYVSDPERFAGIGMVARSKSEEWPIDYGVKTIKSILTQNLSHS
jgi:glycosyltransferase involved in cell wall biosynthesis